MLRHRSHATTSREDRPREPWLRLALAWAALAWERAAAVLWPLAAAVAGFVILALLDVLPSLPGWLHFAALAAVAIVLLFLSAAGVRDLNLPTRPEARRRIEIDSGLAHRPLSGISDIQAAGLEDAASRRLWRHHQKALRESVRNLRVAWPTPMPVERDPLLLRGLVALLLVVAVVAAGDDRGPRIARALSPQLAGGAAASPSHLDVVIEPPAYTGVASLYLQGTDRTPAETEAEAPAALSVPVGSKVLARVSGGVGQATLWVGGDGVAFDPVDEATQEIEATISGGDSLGVTQGRRTLGGWPIDVVPDARPAIAFVEPPRGTERAALRLSYRAGDDYGVDSAAATIRLADSAPAVLSREPIELSLTVPARRGGEVSMLAFHDLSPHPWAGQAVHVQLSATDGAGQTGVSEVADLVLPERTFTHPVARAIIDQRRTLLTQPDQWPEVSESLEALSLRPARFYDDIVVFLALRTASRRLNLHRGDISRVVDPIQNLLWDTALRLEDGGLSLAERDLRLAEQALRDALAGDASDEEIARLMDDLRTALDTYLKALEQAMQQRLAESGTLEPMPMDPNARVFDRQQLHDLLDRMQQLSESGARDAARQMLSELQELLEGLQPDAVARQQQGGPAMELLEDLQQLMQDQQRLLDETYRMARPGQDGKAGEPAPGSGGEMPQSGQPRPGSSPGGQAAAAQGAMLQEAIRRSLGELMVRMGELGGGIPAPIGRAEQAMRRAEEALGRNLPSVAVGPQGEALDQLQQGIQSFVDQLLEQMAPGGGISLGQGRPPPSGRRDPLGREMPNLGGVDTGDVAIPDEADVQRARAILDELRRRLGEHRRPELERDYIERLLRRF